MLTLNKTLNVSRLISAALFGAGLLSKGSAQENTAQNIADEFKISSDYRNSISYKPAYAPSLRAMLIRDCERDPHIAHILKTHNEAWKEFKPQVFTVRNKNMFTLIPEKEQRLPLLLEDRVIGIVGHSEKIKFERDTGKPWASSNALKIGALGTTRISPNVGAIVSLIDIFSEAKGNNLQSSLERKQIASKDPINKPLGSSALETAAINESIVDNYLHIVTSEQPSTPYAAALAKMNETYIYSLLSGKPTDTEEDLKLKWNRENQLGSLETYKELKALKLKIDQNEQKIIELSKSNSNLTDSQKKFIEELRRETDKIQLEFSAAIKELGDKIQIEFNSQTPQVLQAQTDLINILSDMMGRPEFRDKTREEIHNLVLEDIQIRRNIEQLENYRAFTSSVCTWVSIFDPEASEKLNAMTNVMCSAGAVAISYYNPSSWFALAGSIGNLTGSLFQTGKSDTWRQEFFEALKGIDTNIRSLHEELTIGLAWMQYGFRENQRSLSSVFEGITALDRQIKTIGILLNNSDQRVEEVRLRMIFQYNEEWNRAKAEKNSSFYEHASISPQTAEEAKKALTAFIKHAVSDSWAPVHTASTLPLNNKTITLIPEYVKERGLRNIPTLLHSYVNDILGQKLPGIRLLQPPTAPEEFESARKLVPSIVRNPDEYINGVMEIIHANRTWPADYPRLSESQKQLLISVGEEILNHDRALLAPSVLDALVGRYESGLNQLSQFLVTLEKSPNIRLQAGLGPTLNLNDSFDQFEKKVSTDPSMIPASAIYTPIVFDKIIWAKPILDSTYPREAIKYPTTMFLRDAKPIQEEFLLGKRSTLTPDVTRIKLPDLFLELTPEGRQAKALSQIIGNNRLEIHVNCTPRAAVLSEKRSKAARTYSQPDAAGYVDLFNNEQSVCVDYFVTFSSPSFVTKDNPEGKFLQLNVPSQNPHIYQKNAMSFRSTGWPDKYFPMNYGYYAINPEEAVHPNNRPPLEMTARVNALKGLAKSVVDEAKLIFETNYKSLFAEIKDNKKSLDGTFSAILTEPVVFDEKNLQIYVEGINGSIWDTRIKTWENGYREDPAEEAKREKLRLQATLLAARNQPVFASLGDEINATNQKVAFRLWSQKQADLISEVAKELHNSKSELNLILRNIDASRQMILAAIGVSAEDIVQADDELRNALDGLPSSEEISKLFLRFAEVAKDPKLGSLLCISYPEVCSGIDSFVTRETTKLKVELQQIKDLHQDEQKKRNLGNPGVRKTLELLKNYKTN